MVNLMRAPTLYVLCRIVRPEVIVETGVANGFSSSFILKALEDNRTGRLYSIDFPNQPGHEIDEDRNVGWVIPQELKKRWELLIGDSKEKLPVLVDKLREIDIFYHDSDHSYHHVLFELNTVWNKMRGKSIVSADDINMNSAFIDFAKGKNVKYVDFFWLGIAKI